MVMLMRKVKCRELCSDLSLVCPFLLCRLSSFFSFHLNQLIQYFNGSKFIFHFFFKILPAGDTYPRLFIFVSHPYLVIRLPSKSCTWEMVSPARNYYVQGRVSFLKKLPCSKLPSFQREVVSRPADILVSDMDVKALYNI